jgi:hypothetical protein
VNQSRQITIPEDLSRAAEKRFGGRFSDIQDFVIFLLQEVLRDESIEIDRAEQAAVEQRLRDLGYL